MTQHIDQLMIEAEGRYLKPEEIKSIKDYVMGWPKRQHVYRMLRDHESTMIAQTLSQLQQEIPHLTPQVLELCQRDLALSLRQCGLAMLLVDEELLKERLIEWIEEQARLYDLRDVYEALYRLLQQSLKQHLAPGELEFIRPYVTQAQVALIF